MNSPTELPHKLLLIFGLLCGTWVSSDLRAGSATWSATPISGDWYTAANWNPQTIPNGPNDVATLGASSIVDLTLPSSSTTVLDSLILQPGATFYTVVVQDKSSLTFVGSGAPDLNGLLLSVAAGGTMTFEGSSQCHSRISDSGTMFFQDQSSCASGFSTDVVGGVLTFSDQSSARADINVLGGSAYFNDDSTADNLLLNVYGDGFADISGHHAPGLAISEPYGDGTIFLGANNLTVTSTFLHFGFSGALMDGGASGGTGGSLTKAGPPDSSAIFDGSSSYTGGTTIIGGMLFIETDSHSSTPTGIGDVHVNFGGLGGRGNVQGNVFVGTGAGTPASLIPGKRRRESAGVLTIRRTLTFASDGILEVNINSRTGHIGEASASGVTITSGAQIEVNDRSDSKLATGTVLTLISNTADTPITGTFANLPDGGTVTVKANTYQANYEGGDGNDLTITVID